MALPGRLRVLEHPGSSRALDPMCRVDFIEVAVGADAIFYLIGVAGLTSKRMIGDREPICGSIKLGVWT